LRDKNSIFFIVWCACVFLFFSFSQAKLVPYILPIFPPLAIFSGSLLSQWISLPAQRQTTCMVAESLCFFCAFLSLFIIPYVLKTITAMPQWWLGAAILSPLFLALAYLPCKERITKQQYFNSVYILFGLILAFSPILSTAIVSSYKCGKSISASIKKYLNSKDTLAHFEGYHNSAHFYTSPFSKKRLVVVDSHGELRYGIKKLTRDERKSYFPTLEEFISRWHKKERILGIYRSRQLSLPHGRLAVVEYLSQKLRGSVYVLDWQGEFCLFSNYSLEWQGEKR
jgi:4-amino-4-deoxy-L-arabinose transferase-like glycosyltransferase